MRASSFPRLITFQAVAESGAIVRAAAALGVAPSTVSETITALERDLGVRLFNRTTRNVGLTEAGEVFLGRVRGILTELEGAVAELDPYRGEAMGALRLGVSSLALSVVVAPMLHAFMAAHPRVRLEISIDDDVVGSLMQARVDAGIRGLAGIPQDMIAQRVSPPSRLVAVASPDYLARCGVPSRVCDLAAHNCIGLRLTTGAIWPWTFELEGRSVSFTPQGTLVTDSIDFVLTAACGGIGIAYTVQRHAAEAIEAGRLVEVLPDHAQPFPGWHIYYARREHLPGALRAFIAFLRARAAHEAAAPEGLFAGSEEALP